MAAMAAGLTTSYSSSIFSIKAAAAASSNTYSKSKRTRRPQNVDGDLFVDNTCIDCDTCRWMAPEIFDRQDGMSAVFKQPTCDEERLKALQALLSCPTNSIHTEQPPRDILDVHKTFPSSIDEQKIPGVYHCGYHSEKSYGATSYFITRPEGNILIDSPRYTERLASNIKKIGGARYMFLTHKDDVADHDKWSKELGCTRILHSQDECHSTADVEIKLEGSGPWTLDSDVILVHTPGHTAGSVCLFYKTMKVLFTGDHLLMDEFGLSILEHYNWFSVSEQLNSVHKLLELDFEWILPATILDEVLESVQPRVSEAMNRSLCSPYTSTEVKIALNQMHPLKSPGPDGMSPIFFQHFWHLVGKDISVCVIESLNNKSFLPKFNYTHIVLIPKVDKPESVSQFRPISLCNVVYKIISKCIANRLKPILNDIISESQSAFIPGRLITDNVLIAYEINHFLKNKNSGKEGFAALKLDMSKAYDRVEWIFLERVLLRFGFNKRMIDLIMLCVRSVTYSFMLTGTQFGYLEPQRGIRQGDPLSPYLFLFCAEVFSCLIQAEERKGEIRGVSICPGAPIISHLLFADDTLIFMGADAQSMWVIKDILHKYALASGQEINLQKSSMVVSNNVSRSLARGLATILGVQLSDKHEKYLGLPAIVGRSKKDIFASLRNRIHGKIEGWSSKFLSQAGKEVLLKAVVQSIPTYTMGCFRLPDTLIREIESTMANFWWSNRNSRKIHWLAWSKLCHKKEDGGLGFRELKTFNLAMLAKQGWRLIHYPDNLLSRLLKARYFPDSDYLSASLGSAPSYTWRSILDARHIIKHGCRWRIGNGKSVSIWTDPWLPRPSNFFPFTCNRFLPLNAKVSSIIDQQTEWWNIDLIDTVFCPEDAAIIKTIPLGSSHNTDRLVWNFSKSGTFDVKSAYHLAKDIEKRGVASSSLPKPTGVSWQFIWKARVPPKIRVFAWKACKQSLPTAHNLLKRQMDVYQGCHRCDSENEDLSHTLLLCPFSRLIWAVMELPIQVISDRKGTIEAWIRSCHGKLDADQFGLFLTVLWYLWYHRNQKVMENNDISTDSLVSMIRSSHVTFGNLTEDPRIPIIDTTCLHWSPPANGWVKINFDGALFTDPQGVGVGIVARDSNGTCLRWQRRFLARHCSAEGVEALACVDGLRLALLQGWSNVVLEGDCLSLIQKINSPSEDMSSVGSLV